MAATFAWGLHALTLADRTWLEGSVAGPQVHEEMHVQHDDGQSHRHQNKVSKDCIQN